MSAKVEEPPLAFKIKVKYEPDASAAEGDHACCLVVGLGNVSLKVIVDVHGTQLLVGRVAQATVTLDQLNVALGLDQLPEHKILNGRRIQLAHVRIVELISEHAGGARDHEVAGKDRGAGPEYFVGRWSAPTRLCPVDNVVLKKGRVVGYLDAGC